MVCVHVCFTFTDVDLLVCKHQGPSCCTRKMEESYQLAVKRETLHNIHSYSYELEHILSGHSDAFQGKCWDKSGQAGAAWLGLDGIGHWVADDGHERDVDRQWLVGCYFWYILFLPLPGTDISEC